MIFFLYIYKVFTLEKIGKGADIYYLEQSGRARILSTAQAIASAPWAAHTHTHTHVP